MLTCCQCYRDVNNNIMELLIMAYACKTSSARNIVGVIPYLPYCKQSKMRKRGCIVSKLLAKMMCKLNFSLCLCILLPFCEILYMLFSLFYNSICGLTFIIYFSHPACVPLFFLSAQSGSRICCLLKFVLLAMAH